jgi:hypothetical protein
VKNIKLFNADDDEEEEINYDELDDIGKRKLAFERVIIANIV